MASGIRTAAVILAAGKGTRMGSSVPKQYLDLCGKPVLWHSVAAFDACSAVDEIVIAADKDSIPQLREKLLEADHFPKVREVIPGGRQRFDSVRLSLMFLQERAGRKPDYVFIHDGARPCVTDEIIRRNLEEVKRYRAVATGMPVKDTIKLCNSENIVTDTPDRRFLWQVQTPQTFSFPLICEAYRKLDQLPAETVDGITDDAMVVEKTLGHTVRMVEGSYANMKITTPEDLLIAEVLLKNVS